VNDLVREGAENWEAIADGWAERIRTGTDQPRRYVLDPAHWTLLGDVAGKRVLDAGCGEGRFARQLAERGANVTAFDLSERMIAHARESENEKPLGIEYCVADMTDLSRWPDAFFDVAISYLSIIDVEDYESATREIARVLKPGGQFTFSVVHPCFAPPGATWEPSRPGIIPIMDKDKLYKKIDNYFPARELRFKMWPTAPADTINYHRPISDYARTCRNAGFQIRDIAEPLPPDEILAQRDDMREYLRAPYFMIFDCVKA
jgi:2-polyprenyl-3-methyl-5-hydroxy-6-metoxy-1,4-benzoquinol methylase